MPPQWRDTVLKVIRQRLALHEHPEALADALQAVPRSRPFAELSELAAISVPTIVVASDDEADPGHPRGGGGGVRGGDPRRAAGDRRAGPLAGGLAGQPAVQADRRGWPIRCGREPSAAGYSGTPLVRKLGIKPGARLALIGAPDGFDATLGELPDGVRSAGGCADPAT